MKYKIKPYGCSRWLVQSGLFPFSFLLKQYKRNNGPDYSWVWEGFVSDDWIYEYLYSSIDEAKEAIKTAIVQNGIAKAHNRQTKKRTKLHAKEKTIIVPPWK